MRPILETGAGLTSPSGTPWLSGRGILLSIIVLSAGIISWISVHTPLHSHQSFLLIHNLRY